MLLNFGKNIAYKDIVSSAYEESLLNFDFIFYLTISTSIGILGFLSNSSPVIMAAMFVSPLMSPIISFSFALATFDRNQIVKNLKCFTVAIFVAVFVSYIVVGLSPITEITTEITSRTNPNLFDLIIAFLSGIGSSYSYIKKKYLSVVGAAMATAILTPLIVLGFGLATYNTKIILGSSFLFLTNFTTVLIAIFVMCRLFGFRKDKEEKFSMIEIITGLSVLLSLSVPLTISLKDIAYQSYAVKVIRNTIEEYFDNDLHYLNKFSISFEDGQIRVDSVMSVKHFDPRAEQTIRKNIADKLAQEIKLNLIQVALASKKHQEFINQLTPQTVDELHESPTPLRQAG